MDTLTTKAIARAIQQLTNLGCTCKVMHEGAVVYDTLPVEEVPKKPRAKVAYLYKEAMDALQPGQVCEFPLPSPEHQVDLKGWQRILSGAAVARFGKGTCMSECTPTGVNLLRIE